MTTIMTRDARFDVLFKPMAIGPVTAKNRFYQVPHCTGMGYALPHTLAAMREVKAEGGWGVVCSEYCSIHPSSDDLPAPYASLWDAGDSRNMAVIAERIHAHGALAGVELWHGGLRASNLLTRLTAIAPESLPGEQAPVQTRRMDRADIAAYRKAHRQAALRAKRAGYDIVYVYAAHSYLAAQFLDARINRGAGRYAGSLENRARILSDLLTDTKEAVGDTCAVAIRIEVDNEDTPDADPHGERRRLFELIADLPDLFDVTVSDYSREMGVSRFVKEASLEPMIAQIKKITRKPVVSVGRLTSPETMLGLISRGVQDFIGAARPSIADPFLPRKIEEGRPDDIRECIGCNICYAGDTLGVPIRCTQNPTMGEEWRRAWHPERVAQASAKKLVLVVGAGPAGLEAALTLGRAGHQVMLAEARRELGGRVSLESRLPGLSEWIRVRDYRAHQLSKLDNVEIFRESMMTPADIRAVGADHVFLATGSHWRSNGMGHSFPAGVASYSEPRTLTPDDILGGRRPSGPVVVFDDDHYLMAALIAELLAREGHDTTYVTPAGIASSWTTRTLEQARGQRRLIESGVRIVTSSMVAELVPGGARLACAFTGAIRDIPCGGFIPVTSREPNDTLWRALLAEQDDSDLPPDDVQRIGDCNAPGLIATAVYDAHRAARDFLRAPEECQPRRELVLLS